MGFVTILRRYDIEAAHQLSGGLSESHRCRRLHGHRYEVTLHVTGNTDEHGVLIEYSDLDTIVGPIFRLADHHSLNTLDERCSTHEAALVAQNPTAERIAEWLGVRLYGIVRSGKADGQNLRLARLEVWEDSMSGAAWEVSS